MRERPISVERFTGKDTCSTYADGTKVYDIENKPNGKGSRSTKHRPSRGGYGPGRKLGAGRRVYRMVGGVLTEVTP